MHRRAPVTKAFDHCSEVVGMSGEDVVAELHGERHQVSVDNVGRAGPTEQTPDWAAVLALPGTHLHLYGKTRARAGRKMGHLTLTGPNAEAVQTTAAQAAACLGLVDC